MRIAVLGAGAIGGVVAAQLALTDRDVALVARGKILERLRNSPLSLEEADGRQRAVHVPVFSHHELPGPIDLAICCVKTPDLASALEPLESVLATDAVVLTVQNGVEAHQHAAAILPRQTIVASRMHGFFEADGLKVRHVGVLPSLIYGCTSGDATHGHACIEEAFEETGIAVSHSADILRDLWEKFMLSACLGSVGTALGIRAGLIWSTPSGPELLEDAMTEVAALARHVGVALTTGHADATLAFSRSIPQAATTSLQRDIETGKKSEYHALTGAVCRIAEAAGFAAPTFAKIECMIAARYPQASME